MNSALARLLQAIVSLVFLGLLLAQVLGVPALAARVAEAEPDYAWARGPLSAALIAALLCLQAVLLAMWRLLALIRSGDIFRGAGRRWVDVIVAALVALWLLILATTVWQSLTGANAPAVFLFEAALLLAGPVIVLLMLVMRGLFLEATDLRVEMDEVV